VSEIPEFDWSARHTRLRYQTVLTSLAFLMVVVLGVESIQIPGFISFEEKPDVNLIRFSALLFGLFSLISFVTQDALERHLRPLYVSRSSAAIKQVRKEVIQNSNLQNRLSELYTSFESLFDGFEPVQNKQQPWKGEQEIWLPRVIFEGLSAELKSCKAEIIESLHRFDQHFPHAMHHFPNFFPLFEAVEVKVDRIKSALGYIVDKPHVTKGGNEKLEVGFRLSSLNFDRSPVERLFQLCAELEEDLNRLSKIMLSYRVKLFLQTNFLSLILPVLVSSGFILVGIFEWLR